MLCFTAGKFFWENLHFQQALLALSPWLLSLLWALCAEQGLSAAGMGQEGDKEGTDPNGVFWVE